LGLPLSDLVSANRQSFFHVNLCTYGDLARAGQVIVDFIEMATHLADAAGIALRISLERERPRRQKAGRKLTPSTWREIRRAVLEGAYGYLFVFNDTASGLARTAMPDRAISFGLTIQAADMYAGIAARIRDRRGRERFEQAARVNPRFVNLAIAVGEGGLKLTDDELGRTLQTVRDTFRQVDGACGFVTLDPFQFIGGDLTQHELSRRVYWATTPDMYRTRLRGAFWGNLLGPRHVALLGGFARVAVEAPCTLAEPLEFGQSSGAYLQLAADPARVTAQQLEALTVYLRPLLP
jgi:hypothetical protein